MEGRLHELATVMDHLRPHEVFSIAGIPVYSTVVSTWIVMVLLILMAVLATRRLKFIPRGWQHLPEMAVEFIYGLLEPFMGRKGRIFAPIVGGFFIIILFLNLSWLIPGMKPATMDLSTTLAFAVSAIIIVQIISIRENGFKGWIKHYFAPMAAMAPLNIIEELVKPISLSLRLFGNLFGEEMVVVILFILIPFFVPTPVQLLGVLMGFIQAFVFTLLTVTYITAHVEGH